MGSEKLLAPLQGVRVFDTTANIAGPFATMILSDLGADVIKVEDPERGDEARYMPPFTEDTVSTVFAAYNRGKRSIALDLTDPKAQEQALSIAATCDIFVESMRPGKLAKLGLGWDRVSAARPDVVYASISAFGGVGPRGNDAGYDAMIQAYSGLMDLTGPIGGQPSRVGTGVIDLGTGMWAVINILGALRQVQATGQGVRVPIVMLETSAAFMMHHLTAVRFTGAQPTRNGTAQHAMAPYEAMEAADGLLMIAAPSQRLWRILCQVLGAPELVDDPRFHSSAARVQNRPAMLDALQQRTRQFQADQLERLVHEAGIPVSRIRPVHELDTDPQMEALQFWQPVGDSPGYSLPVAPLRVGDWRPSIPRGAPGLGEHTREIINEAQHLLGSVSAGR